MLRKGRSAEERPFQVIVEADIYTSHTPTPELQRFLSPRCAVDQLYERLYGTVRRPTVGAHAVQEHSIDAQKEREQQRHGPWGARRGEVNDGKSATEGEHSFGFTADH